MLCLKLLICSGDISIINGILSIPSGNSGFVSAKTSLVHECNFTDKCTAKPSLLSGSIQEAMAVSVSMNLSTERTAAMTFFILKQ